MFNKAFTFDLLQRYGKKLKWKCSTHREKKKVWRNCNQGTRTTRAPSARVIITEPQALPVTVLYVCQAVTSLCFPCVIASASAILISYPVVTFLFPYLKQVPQQLLSAPKVRLCWCPKASPRRTRAERAAAAATAMPVRASSLSPLHQQITLLSIV